MKNLLTSGRVWAAVKKIAVVGMVAPGMVVSNIGALALFSSPIAHADTIGPIDFESPAYTVGLINGQDGWTATGASGSGCAVYDEGVAGSLSTAGFGAQSFRISDAVTSGCFGDQAFAKPVIDAAGETAATAGTFSVGTRQSHFEAQFDIASTKPGAQQPGLHISVSPDRGDGSRMSYLRFEDGTAGIDVFFDDVQGTSNPANFVETQIAAGLDRTKPHTVKFSMDFIDGPSNDVVRIFIDGNLVHTGTTWENYYRFDTEASAEQSPRITKTLLFRAAGSAVPGDQGNGFLFDNISLVSGPIPPATVKVTLAKYLDGAPATPQSANNASFPMTATWNAVNIGAGSGGFSLGPVGFNNPNPYQATTADMTTGASYSAIENLPTTCDAGNPYALVGYSTGDTLQGAASSTVSTTTPGFTQLAGDKFIVVWNKTCPPVTLLKVRILKYLDGVKADATSSAGYQFPMTATWQTANLNGGVSTSGNYVLGNNHGGAPDLYGADTSPMAAPADYTTKEITNDIDVTSKVVPIGGTCAPGDFQLSGYKSSAVSFDDAALQAATATAPVFTGLSSDRYVLVLNTTCPTVGSLIVNKVAVGGNGTFSFTGDGGIGGFSITTALGAGSATFAVAQGTVNITETAQDGWAVTGNTCLQATVTAGATSTCTITNTKLGEIRGTKYEDTKQDGDDEHGDEHGEGHVRHGLPGWTIYLDANNNGTLDEDEQSMVTDAYGNYDFKNLLPGTYHVREVMQDGWTQVYPKHGQYQIALAAGQIAKEKDFRNFRNGSISGMKFYDKNGDRKKDHGETGLANWTIKLMKDNHTVATTVTDEEGNYSFTNVGPGTYKLREVQQPGWQQTTTNPSDIHMFSGEARTGVDFGNRQLQDITHGHGNNRS